jgi:hypothetical protein
MTSIQVNRGVINNMKIKNTKFSPNYVTVKKKESYQFDSMYKVNSPINTENLSDSLENEPSEKIHNVKSDNENDKMDYSQIHLIQNKMQTLKSNQEKIDIVMDSKLDRIQEEQRVPEDLIEKQENPQNSRMENIYVKNYNFYINCSECSKLLACESKF